MNDDLMKQILDIPALAEFNAEPVPQLDVPSGQRVREWLAGMFGSAWHSAHIEANTLPTGQIVYTVYGVVGSPLSGKLGKLIVGETPDGSFAIAPPIPLSDEEDKEDENDQAPMPLFLEPDRERAYRNEQHCLARILPALMEASNIIAAAEDVKPYRKKRLRAQIAHACKHLQINLENIRRGA